MLQRTDTGRRTGNQPWTALPSGPISGKIVRSTLRLKEIVKPGMTPDAVAEASQHLNVIMVETERVEGLEIAADITKGARR